MAVFHDDEYGGRGCFLDVGVRYDKYKDTHGYDVDEDTEAVVRSEITLAEYNTIHPDGFQLGCLYSHDRIYQFYQVK